MIRVLVVLLSVWVIACGPSKAACDSTNCNGCCSLNPEMCVGGTTDRECGSGGTTCVNCANGSAGHCNFKGMNIGRCSPCSPENCTGCCSAFGSCLSGNETTDCGKGGATCTKCAGTMTCKDKVCS